MCTIICENEIIPRQLALRIEVDADELALKCKINNWVNHAQNDPQHMQNDIWYMRNHDLCGTIKKDNSNNYGIKNKSIWELKLVKQIYNWVKNKNLTLLWNQSYKSWGVIVSGSFCISKGLENWVRLDDLVLQGHLCIEM